MLAGLVRSQRPLLLDSSTSFYRPNSAMNSIYRHVHGVAGTTVFSLLSPCYNDVLLCFRGSAEAVLAGFQPGVTDRITR